VSSEGLGLVSDPSLRLAVKSCNGIINNGNVTSLVGPTIMSTLRSIIDTVPHKAVTHCVRVVEVSMPMCQCRTLQYINVHQQIHCMQHEGWVKIRQNYTFSKGRSSQGLIGVVIINF
jgi:hypothetical protein